jgi:hypothetical protein
VGRWHGGGHHCGPSRKERTTSHRCESEKASLSVASGDAERWEDDKPPGMRTRFIEVDKKFDALLRCGWHGPSLFDSDLDGPPPGLSAHRACD